MTFPRDCDGDYRKDLDLELGNGQLFKSQSALQQLPVPDLKSTIDKWLATVKPLVSSEQYDATVQVAQQFLAPGGIGSQLHSRLLQRAQASKNTSWLAQWWNQWGYLQVRDPVVINVSYYFHFSDNPNPAQRSQAGRAAALVHATMTFRHQVITGALPPEKMGKDQTPLDATPYKYMFNSCRIPRREQDSVRLYKPADHHHITVMANNRFFTVEVCSTDGTPRSRPEIEAQLERVLAQAGPSTHPVGVLTAQDRDAWADARVQLLSDGNAELLAEIESSALVVCLDDSAPVTSNEVARALWHGDGRNRFFDKTIQLVVFANGKAGLVGEHSLIDGMPMVRLADYVLTQTMGSQKEQALTNSRPGSLAQPRPVDVALSPASLRNIAKAEVAFDTLIDRHVVDTLSFVAFGSDVIKTFQVSPDGFAQLAIQLAYYKMTGTLRAVYEPAQVRKFLHGRTACVRSVSNDSKKWVLEMTKGPRVPTAHKLKLLRAAAQSHIKYAGEAANGLDVDRHLLGLSMLLKDGEQAKLFQDPSFKLSKHWHISTSQISHEFFDGWGFGEVVPDGIGCAYIIKKRSLHFMVSSLKDADVSPTTMCHYLQESMLEMRSLGEAERTITSKL